VKARLETIFSKGPCRDARVDDAVADADIRGLPQILLAKRGPAIIILSGDCDGYRGTLSAL
jgi:hypothetical protein